MIPHMKASETKGSQPSCPLVCHSSLHSKFRREMLSSPREVMKTRTSFLKPATMTKNYYSNTPLCFYIHELTMESLGLYLIVGLKIPIP